MKNIKLAALASAALFAAAAPASATIINFDDGTAGMAVGNFYAAKGVTFSNTSFASAAMRLAQAKPSPAASLVPFPTSLFAPSISEMQAVALRLITRWGHLLLRTNSSAAT